MESRVCRLPQSTFRYDSSEHVGKLLTRRRRAYTRLANQRLTGERKIVDLEGEQPPCVHLPTSYRLLSASNTGDHIISSGTIYGGTMNLWLTFCRDGIECTFVNSEAPLEEPQKEIKDIS